MRGAKFLVVGFFLALLLLPALQMATGAVRIRPLDENRRYAAFPAATADVSDYVAKLQAWFDDHYGFRALLIRAKAQLDYSVFGASERLHIGRDGFLFYRSVIDVEEPRNERLTDADLDRTIANFAAIRDRMAARGIRLIVQTQQLKDKFYPEMLPRSAWFARDRHRFDDLRGRLATLPGITYIDSTPILSRLKAERPIFHKTDFHWNDPAAFVLAGTLVDTIAGLAGEKVPFWHVRLEIEPRKFSGGQALFMPLFKPPSETGLFVKPTWDDSLYTRTAPAPFDWVAVRTRDRDARLLPPTVIFGDSFTDGMTRAGLTTHFEQLSYARLYHYPLAEVLDALPADTKFLVIEFIETAWPYYMMLDVSAPPKRTG